MNQPRIALRRANEIRIGGSQVRKALAALPERESKRKAAGILRRPPECIERMRLGHFLTGIHGFGERRALALANKAGPSAWNRRIIRLSARQLLTVIGELER